MRVGVFLPKYSTSQLAFECICSINNHILSQCIDDYVLFYENAATFVKEPLCAAMLPDEMCLFNDGVIVSTNLSNLESSIKTINTSKKVLYLGDVEWLRRGYSRTYKQNYDLLQSTDIVLICRSNVHKELLSMYCGRKDIVIMQDFDVPSIVGMLKSREE